MFIDRVSENPKRRKLSNIDTTTEAGAMFVDFDYADDTSNGTEGTPINAANLNAYTGCVKIFEYSNNYGGYLQSNTWCQINSPFNDQHEYTFVLRVGQGTYLTTVSGIFINWGSDLKIYTDIGYNGIYVELENDANTGKGRFRYLGTTNPDTLVKIYERKIITVY